MNSFILTLSCPDRIGIVAAVASCIASHCGSIIEANQFGDPENERFFLRQRISADTLTLDLDHFREQFAKIAREFNMEWTIEDSSIRKKMVVLVSRMDHCLAEILYRWRTGDIFADIQQVISNHEDLRKLVEWHGIPYTTLPVSPETKAESFEKLDRMLEDLQPDLIVLARYMQVLPQAICQKYFKRIINIHHSFLPSFQGARPYHQAHEKGVKLIGATCHFVTTELDEGPIIEQEVIRVDHSQRAEDFIKLGRDVEKVVLSRGIQYHLENRVLLNGRKTVVFR